MTPSDDEAPAAAASAARPNDAATLIGSSNSPAAAAAPAPPPSTDPCPFCLEPLVGSGALALPCGHAFHSVCALQFLLRKQQCPVCRAPVDETLVRDVGALPECSGRSFVQQASSRADSGSKAGRSGGGSAGHIQLQAFAGSSSSAAARPPWLPNAHPTLPPRQPLSGPVRVTLGDQGALDSATNAADGVSRPAPAAPLHTIRVVRPRPAWVRLVLLGLLVSGFVAVLIAIPLAFGKDGPQRHGRGGGGGSTSGGGGAGGDDDSLEACWACLFNDNPAWDCRSACWGT